MKKQPDRFCPQCGVLFISEMNEGDTIHCLLCGAVSTLRKSEIVLVAKGERKVERKQAEVV